MLILLLDIEYCDVLFSLVFVDEKAQVCRDAVLALQALLEHQDVHQGLEGYDIVCVDARLPALMMVPECAICSVLWVPMH